MIYLSAGHYPDDKGAYCGGVNEHDVAKQWVHTLAAACASRVRVCNVVPTGTVMSKAKWVNNRARPEDILIEVHFNSDESRKQRGSETLYCPGSQRGQALAAVIQRALAGVCAPDRGAKPGWYRMDRPGVIDYEGDKDGDEAIDYLLRATVCTAIIIEPEFIYNYNTIIQSELAACAAVIDAVTTFVDNEDI